MFDILFGIAVFGIVAFVVFAYLKARAEAKHCGFISDDYIENNEEDEDNG